MAVLLALATVQCTLCSYGSCESLVSAPREVHLLRHVVKHHWVWWISLDWEGEIPSARYRDWKKSRYNNNTNDDPGDLMCSDKLTGGTATPCDVYSDVDGVK